MNSLLDHITPGITAMIRMDHSHVLALLRRYKPGVSNSRKKALVTNACLALEIHAELEEEIFYPALRDVMGDDPMLQKSEPEHDEMRGVIGELRGRLGAGAVGDPGFDEMFLDLIRLVIHHVADEETRLLPAAERLLADRLVELGGQMSRRRAELMKPHATEITVTTARSFPAGAALLAAGALAIGAALLPKAKKGVRRFRLRP
jgi:hemerythrin-like domain-containing protein